MERREFIKKTSLTAGALAMNHLISPFADGSSGEESESSRLARRAFGGTGIELSVIGFGGIVLMGHEQKECNALVAEAVDQGVNYFDVAPSYGNGEAEINLGPALEPYRKKCFLACKTARRDREGAAADLKQSLERLKTDTLDLYQLHGITDVEKDVDAAFVKGGAMEVFLEAKKSGQVRYLGFSAHSEGAALAALERYDFDSILFPVNMACWYKGKFGQRVLDKAVEKGASILALKMLAEEKWPDEDPLRKEYPKAWYQPIVDKEMAALAVAFTLSQPITAALPPGDIKSFRFAIALARQFKPLTAEQTNQIKYYVDSKNPLFAAKA